MPPLDLRKEVTHGGWSSWISTECSKSCGGGVGQSVRFCNNPVPSLLGRGCRGKAKRTGACNTRPCGMVTAQTEDLIRKIIREVDMNKRVNVYESTIIKCRGGKAFRAVLKDAPTAVFFWQHSTGLYFENNTYSKYDPRGRAMRPSWQVPDVNVDEDYNLVIESGNPEQTGLWQCVAQTGPKTATTVKAIPFVVDDSQMHSSLRTAEGIPLLLTCNGRGLSDLTQGDLSQVWTHNGTNYSQIYDVDTNVNDVLYIPVANRSHSGLWTCYYVHNRTRVRYNTGWRTVKVTEQPALEVLSVHKTIMQEERRSRYTKILMVVVVCFFLLLIRNMFLFVSMQAQARECQELEDEMEHLEDAHYQLQLVKAGLRHDPQETEPIESPK